MTSSTGKAFLKIAKARKIILKDVHYHWQRKSTSANIILGQTADWSAGNAADKSAATEATTRAASPSTSATATRATSA